jgi:hypothetical protein
MPTPKEWSAPIPSAGTAIDFEVPLLPGAHVTADTGTGFVHTAPGTARTITRCLANRELSRQSRSVRWSRRRSF